MRVAVEPGPMSGLEHRQQVLARAPARAPSTGSSAARRGRTARTAASPARAIRASAAALRDGCACLSVTWGWRPSPPKLPWPTSSPTITPWSRSLAPAIVSPENVKRARRGRTRSSSASWAGAPGRGLRERDGRRDSAAAQRRDHEVAVGLGALGVRLHVVAVLEVLVDDLALRSRSSRRARPAGRSARRRRRPGRPGAASACSRRSR